MNERDCHKLVKIAFKFNPALLLVAAPMRAWIGDHRLTAAAAEKPSF